MFCLQRSIFSFFPISTQYDYLIFDFDLPETDKREEGGSRFHCSSLKATPPSLSLFFNAFPQKGRFSPIFPPFKRPKFTGGRATNLFCKTAFQQPGIEAAFFLPPPKGTHTQKILKIFLFCGLSGSHQRAFTLSRSLHLQPPQLPTTLSPLTRTLPSPPPFIFAPPTTPPPFPRCAPPLFKKCS